MGVQDTGETAVGGDVRAHAENAGADGERGQAKPTRGSREQEEGQRGRQVEPQMQEVAVDQVPGNQPPRLPPLEGLAVQDPRAGPRRR